MINARIIGTALGNLHISPVGFDAKLSVPDFFERVKGLRGSLLNQPDIDFGRKYPGLDAIPPASKVVLGFPDSILTVEGDSAPRVLQISLKPRGSEKNRWRVESEYDATGSGGESFRSSLSRKGQARGSNAITMSLYANPDQSAYTAEFGFKASAGFYVTPQNFDDLLNELKDSTEFEGSPWVVDKEFSYQKGVRLKLREKSPDSFDDQSFKDYGIIDLWYNPKDNSYQGGIELVTQDGNWTLGLPDALCYFMHGYGQHLRGVRPDK